MHKKVNPSQNVSEQFRISKLNFIENEKELTNCFMSKNYQYSKAFIITSKMFFVLNPSESPTSKLKLFETNDNTAIFDYFRRVFEVVDKRRRFLLDQLHAAFI